MTAFKAATALSMALAGSRPTVFAPCEWTTNVELVVARNRQCPNVQVDSPEQGRSAMRMKTILRRSERAKSGSTQIRSTRQPVEQTTASLYELVVQSPAALTGSPN